MFIERKRLEKIVEFQNNNPQAAFLCGYTDDASKKDKDPTKDPQPVATTEWLPQSMLRCSHSLLWPRTNDFMYLFKLIIDKNKLFPSLM